MIPIKIQCGCGQKYSFEVEPRDGRIDGTIQCPVCGMDGTDAMNQLIAQHRATQSNNSNLRESMRSKRSRWLLPTIGGVAAVVVILVGTAWFHASGRDEKHS